jgi:signal transduction histidine kinase
VISLSRVVGAPRLLFALCLILVFFALGWTSATLIQMETSQRADRLWQESGEVVHHALTAADTGLFQWIAVENSHPYFDYLASHAPERRYDDMFAPPQANEALAPSPFLLETNPFVRLHFLVAPAGEISSPEAPAAGWRVPASAVPAAARAARTAHDLAALRSTRAGANFHAIFPAAASAAIRRAEASGGGLFSARESPPAPAGTDDGGGAPRFTGAITSFYPAWLDGELYLLRRIGTTQGDSIQGIWVDWSFLRNTLIGAVAERLPGARYLPAPEIPAKKTAPIDMSENEYHLIALPAVLKVAAPDTANVPAFSRTRLLLAVCWVFAAFALLGSGGLFLGTVALSERRASFVSAVTHELRTPLTTFQLYTEMLATDMVSEDVRKDYLATLHSESVRLSHLVENVLDFARLEKGRTLRRDETLSVGAILGRCEPRIRDRLEACGMTLVCHNTDTTENLLLLTDGTAVEQILFNLADNASKYASGPGRSVTLSINANANTVVFSFADNGTGIPASALKKIFQPFNRSAEDAAGSKPGVGLGLALSRQLARRLGGDLKLAHTGPDGTTFHLYILRSPAKS